MFAVVCISDLDVCSRQIVLGRNEFLEVDVVRERHALRVDAEHHAAGSDIRKGELDFAIDTTGANQGGVQCLDTVGRHDHLESGGEQNLRKMRKNEGQQIERIELAEFNVVSSTNLRTIYCGDSSTGFGSRNCANLSHGLQR
jgi:hypothetical protein